MFGDSWVLRLFGLRWSWFAPAGLVGLVWRRRAASRLPLHALVVLQMLGVVAFFVTSRYRLVAVPWLGIAAGAALAAAVAGDPRARVRLGAGFVAALALVVPGWYGLSHPGFGRPDFDLAEVLARRGLTVRARCAPMNAPSSAIRTIPTCVSVTASTCCVSTAMPRRCGNTSARRNWRHGLTSRCWRSAPHA